MRAVLSSLPLATVATAVKVRQSSLERQMPSPALDRAEK